MKEASHITVPVLVMHSSHHVNGCSWTPAFQHGDAVLDPSMIARHGQKLGKNPVIATIDSGLHDLILSAKPIRDAAYDTIFKFIRTH